MHNRFRLGLLLAPLALSLGSFAQEAYPSKPIRMVVPFGAGGPTDLVARLSAEGMAKRLGQPVVVENRPGAGGRIGLEVIATLPPDGYTIGFIAGTLPSLQAFSKDWKRDVVSSYTYIGSMVESNSLLWAPANAPGNTLAPNSSRVSRPIRDGSTSRTPHPVRTNWSSCTWIASGAWTGLVSTTKGLPKPR